MKEGSTVSLSKQTVRKQGFSCARLQSIGLLFIFGGGSFALALIGVPFAPHSGGIIPVFAWSCAGLSLVWSLSAWIVRIRSRSNCPVAYNPAVEHHSSAVHDLPTTYGSPPNLKNHFVDLALATALMWGVVAGLIQVMHLLMRVIYVALDLLNGFRWQGPRDTGFAPHGLWTLLVVMASCILGLRTAGDPRLYTCLFWCAVMVGGWASLLLPVFKETASGSFHRTGSTLTLLVAFTAVLVIGCFLGPWLERRNGQAGSPQRWSPFYKRRDSSWPGYFSSCLTIGAVIVVLVVYHLAVPLANSLGVFSAGATVVTGSAALSSFSCIVLALRSGNKYLADTGFALSLFALCGLATIVLPSHATTLGERYPVLFNAMMVGAAVSGGIWISLTIRWRCSSDELAEVCCADTADGGSSGCAPPADFGMLYPSLSALPLGIPPSVALPLRERREMTAQHASPLRLANHARRAAFSSLCLAAVFGFMLAIWPRLPSIAVMDDSLSRVAAGFCANLLLLMVVQWSRVALGRPSSTALTLMVFISLIGFVAIRVLPFTPAYV